MILKEFKSHDLNLQYFAGISQIKIDLNRVIDTYKIESEEKVLTLFFEIINKLQYKYANSVIQFIKSRYVLNEDHIFTACYYLEKAFRQSNNLSNKKNIELLLYLAANRQINKSIEGFGIDNSDLKEQKLITCIVSPKNNVNRIYEDLLRILLAEELKLKINEQNSTKINLIKNYFEFSDIQINTVLKSYGITPNNSKLSLSELATAIYDLICEKMALLSVERRKS